MRSVCFVDRLELDFSGKILADAIALGDIDNDGENELVIGTVTGELYIFKGEKLWQTITGLGMIASIGVGDIMKCGSNAVVTLSGEGWCYFHMCINQSKVTPCEKLHLVYQRRIPTNTMNMVLGDIEGDGQIDMVLGLTDRVIRIYRWLQTREVASLVCLNKFECANQIGSVCIGKEADGNPCILVSQPSGTYMTISNCQEKANVEYHEVPSSRLTGSCINSQIIGCVQSEASIAIIALDGTIIFVTNDKLMWTLNLEQQFFRGGKGSICRHGGGEGEDGGEQIVACSWSGNTYIVDTQSNVVNFEMGQAVQSFICGLFSNKKTMSFIYVTFNNKILIYQDITIEQMVLRSLYHYQREDPRWASYSREQLRQLTEHCLYHMRDSDEEDEVEKKQEEVVGTLEEVTTKLEVQHIHPGPSTQYL